MMIFKETRHVVLLDRSTNEYYSFGDKRVLSDFLNVPLDTIVNWFRPVDGVKPKLKRYGNYEIINLDGHYRNTKPNNNLCKTKETYT